MMNSFRASRKRDRGEEGGIDIKVIVSIAVIALGLLLWLELFDDGEDSDTSDADSEAVDGEDIEMVDGEDSDTSESDSASNTQSREETSSISVETSAGKSQNSANSIYVAKKRKLSADSAVGFQRFEAQTEKKFTSALMRLIDAVLDYLRRSRKRLDPKEVFDELNGIPDLGRREMYKALNWLIENEDDFFVVKNLRSDEKKGYILALCQGN